MNEQTPTTYKPSIRHISGTRYDVQSRTRPERTHHADVYHLTCDCEAGQRGKRCWALALAVSYDAWRRQEGKQARQAERAGKQAANWSSLPQRTQPVRVAKPGPPCPEDCTHARAQATGSAVAPVRQTGDLLPLSRWFE